MFQITYLYCINLYMNTCVCYLGNTKLSILVLQYTFCTKTMVIKGCNKLRRYY